MENVKHKRPFGFYVCALGFTFERLAFYTVKYLLAIWIATEAASGGTSHRSLAVTLPTTGSARESVFLSE